MASRESAVAVYLRDVAPPVAMVAYDDLSAVAALRAAHQAGWRVPEDLSVVGIDDIQFAAYTNPALTTVAQPKHELGALAVDALLTGSADHHTGVLDGRLVVRESTARPEVLRLATDAVVARPAAARPADEGPDWGREAEP